MRKNVIGWIILILFIALIAMRDGFTHCICQKQIITMMDQIEQANMLPKELDEPKLYLDGELIYLGMKMEELNTLGWDVTGTWLMKGCEQNTVGNITEITFCPNTEVLKDHMISLKKGSETMFVQVSHNQHEIIPFEDLIVTGIELYAHDGCEEITVVLPKGITLHSSKETIIQAYGMPEQTNPITYSYTDGSNLYFFLQSEKIKRIRIVRTDDF